MNVHLKVAKMNKLFHTTLVGFIFSGAIITASIAQSEQIETNKAVVKKYFEEAVNQRKVELVDELFDVAYLSVLLDAGGKEGRGTEPLKNFLPYLFEAFPDIHFQLEHLVAEGDKVVAHSKTTGTHKSEFWGYPASNNLLEIHEIFIFTLKEGKIISGHLLTDMKNLHDQLSK